jgi:type VII secretion protein EccE
MAMEASILVALLAVAALPGGVGYALGAAVLLPVVTLMAVRWRGHTLLTWSRIGLGYRLRRRPRRARRGPEPADRVLGGAVICEVTDRAGRPFGIVQQSETWSSVCGLAPPEPGRLNGAGPARLPLATLWDAVQEDLRPAATLQVVVHRTVGLAGAARWRTWVSLGLDSRYLRDAVLGRGGGRLGMTRTLTAETSRIAVRAEAAGLLLEPLDAGQLQAAVRENLGPSVLPMAGAGAVDPLVESWHACQVKDLTYRTYQQGGWTGPDGMSEILRSHEVRSATSITTSFLLARGDRGVMRVRPLIRVAARADQLPAVDRELGLLGRRTSTTWRPLDGLQLPGLQATVPLGVLR